MQVPYWIRLPCVIALLATSAPSITFAQQGAVAFDVTTSTGNDTLYVGVQGSIIWSVDSRGNEISALTFPMKFSFSSTGNIIRPVLETGDGVDTAQFIYSPASSVFENRPFNETMGRDFTDNPDTLLFGALDFGGGGWNTSDEVAHLTFTPVDTGVIRIDTSIMAPAGHISALDPDAVEYLNFGSGDDSWQGPYTITVTYPPPCPPVCNDAWVDDVMYVYGDMVTGGIDAYDSDQGPGPLSYYVASTTNSNATGPNNPFVIDAAGNWSWQTSSANEDDVGEWEAVFGVTDGLDSSWCEPVTFTVIAEKPLVCFGFECIEAFSGQDVCVGLYADDFLNPCKELGGFDLLFQYGNTLLTFTGMDMTGSILDALGWEYLTYRVVSTNPAMIRIVAIADMNNSNQHPSGYCLDGLLVNVCFRTTHDRNLACQSAWLSFYWDDCGDNTASSRDGNDLFIVADPANGPWIGGNAGDGVPGGGIISACIGETENLIQFFTGQGGLGGPVGDCCDPLIASIDTSDQVTEGDWLWVFDRSDLNLNGLANEIADVVLYINYFLRGDQVFHDTWRQRQIDASDVNGNWLALTVEDLVYLIRTVHGDELPITERLRGTAGVPDYGDSVDVSINPTATDLIISASSPSDLSAGHFILKYAGTEILDVLTVDRASHMDVGFHAEQGELRVLMYDFHTNQSVAPGSGEILRIITSGGGHIDLLSAEIASSASQTLQSDQLPNPIGDPFVDTTYKACPQELLYFVDGKIQIKCPGDIDDRGDLNLNAVAYEIADAVLYSNYFIMGPGVFMPGVPGEAQVAASDINADGTPLTVADLVYLIRVITGDAEPIPDELLGGGPKVAASGTIDVTLAHEGASWIVSSNSESEVSAGLFVFNTCGLDVRDAKPADRAFGLDVKFEQSDHELRVLLLPRLTGDMAMRERITAGNGPILQIETSGEGRLDLTSVEAATPDAGTLEARVVTELRPQRFALHQNYPNPFNPSTSLAIDFPHTSEYSLTIYNIAGQVVKTYAGQAEASTHTITWDGRDHRGSQVASGVYFYSVTAGEFADVRKMVLMK